MAFELAKKKDYVLRRTASPFVYIDKKGVIRMNSAVMREQELSDEQSTPVLVFADRAAKRIAFKAHTATEGETFKVTKNGQIRIQQLLRKLGFSDFERLRGRYDVEQEEGAALFYIDLNKRQHVKPRQYRKTVIMGDK